MARGVGPALTRITADDLIRGGACIEGVYPALVERYGKIAAAIPIKEALALADGDGQREHITNAASLTGYYGDGYGDGGGDGDGYGDYGYGDGGGDGYGDGDYGYGNGGGYCDGDIGGDGYGFGFSDGDGYGFGFSDGNGNGYGYDY